MAEQVNQRIESMINELEQMKRTNLYNDEEIKEIARKRKEFEYRIQRRVKGRDDFVQYIAFELNLLEDISLRRQQLKLKEKKNDIEYAIAKRLNKVFKQFIFRFQNDVAIYFEYIKFCQSVGFEYAVSAMLGQMLQMHGDKPKMWQMASKWESKEQKNLEHARNFLIKGIYRHPKSELLYLELFQIELMIAFQANSVKDKERYLKRLDVIWRNGMKNIPHVTFLFKLCDLSMKYGIDDTITNSIKVEIWNKKEEKETWSYIASKELEGFHWTEIEEFVHNESNYSNEVNNYIGVYEAALQQFPDESLFTKYINGLLCVNGSVCTEIQKISAIKHVWNYGHENGLLSNDMYVFGIKMLKQDDEISSDEYVKIIDAALAKNSHYRLLWEEKILLNKMDEKEILSIIKDAEKYLKPHEMLVLWNFMFDNIDSNVIFKDCYSRFKTCQNTLILSLKPKLLQKMYEHNGLKNARQIYDEFISTPPIQIEVHKVMLEIESSQEKPAWKNIRKCYEALVQHHGKNNIEVWADYINFEQNNGNAQFVPSIYRRAIATLDKNLVDSFIKVQTLAKLK